MYLVSDISGMNVIMQNDLLLCQVFEDRYHSFSDPDIPRYILKNVFSTKEILFPLHLSNFC